MSAKKQQLIHPGSLKFLEVISHPENRFLPQLDSGVVHEISRNSYSSNELFYEASPSLAHSPSSESALDFSGNISSQSGVQAYIEPFMKLPLPHDIPFQITGLAPQFNHELYAPLASVRVADEAKGYDDETALLNILSLEIVSELPQPKSFVQRLKEAFSFGQETQQLYIEKHPWVQFLKPSSYNPLDDHTESLFPDIEREFSVY